MPYGVLKSVGFLKIAPSLYHEMLNFGMEGGSRLNLPVILKWGSLILGKDHLKLKNPLILLIAFLTMLFAFSRILENLDFMLPNLLETVLTAFERPFEKADLMFANLEETASFASDIFDLNLFATSDSLPPVSLSTALT